MDTLRKAFLAQYQGCNQPMRVLVIAGLNDVRTTSLEDFKNQMVKWKTHIIQQNEKGPLRDIKFCQIPRPPQLVWLNGQSGMPPGFTNYEEKILKMNAAMDNVNELLKEKCDTNFNQVSFVNMGRRKLKNGKETHKFPDWREQDRFNMLHLKDPKRHSMLKRIEAAFSAVAARAQ